jgi:hypothetical protein
MMRFSGLAANLLIDRCHSAAQENQTGWFGNLAAAWRVAAATAVNKRQIIESTVHRRIRAVESTGKPDGDN